MASSGSKLRALENRVIDAAQDTPLEPLGTRPARLRRPFLCVRVPHASRLWTPSEEFWRARDFRPARHGLSPESHDSRALSWGLRSLLLDRSLPYPERYPYMEQFAFARARHHCALATSGVTTVGEAA